jgi:hypothetical protein
MPILNDHSKNPISITSSLTEALNKARQYAIDGEKAKTKTETKAEAEENNKIINKIDGLPYLTVFAFKKEKLRKATEKVKKVNEPVNTTGYKS